MGRPRRRESERIEDAFFDMELAEQDSMLRTLALLHRMKARQASKHWRGSDSVKAGEDAGKPVTNSEAAESLFDEERRGDQDGV